MVKYLENESEFDELIKGRVLVDFYADWCGPCKRLMPILEDIKDIDILKVNVDSFGDLSRSFGIMSIPTLILFDNKKEIKKSLVPYVFLLVFFIGCMIMFKMFNNTVNEITYDDFIKDLNGGKVTELTITPKVRTETYKLTGKLDTIQKTKVSFFTYQDQRNSYQK